MPLRKFIVNLSETEIVARAERCALLKREIAEWNGTLAKAKGQHKEAVATREGEISQLMVAFETHQEEREVDCQEIRNEEHATMDLVRTDTGEVISSRLMTPQEQQRELWPSDVAKPE